MTTTLSGNAAALIATIALVLAPVAAAQQPDGSAAERLVVAFDQLPPGLERNGRYLGEPVVAVDEVLGFAVVEAKDGKSFRAKAQDERGVKNVETDPVRSALAFTPNDPQFTTKQYAPQFVGAPTAWSTTLGASRTICVLDTGLRHTHEDVKGNYAGGIDLVNNDANPMDDNGHGTRVAAAAVASINNGLGIAGVSNAKVLSVKVLDAAGYTHGSSIATGIRWCADNGANIISMSLGGAGNDSATYASTTYAWAKGALLVAGAGNGGCDDCVIYPAALDSVLAVGCVDQSRNACSFTSRGPQVDLAAPGVNIQTAAHTGDTAYTLGGGTSMSTPIVAGAAALVWAAHPTWTNQQVRTALESKTQDVGTAGRDTATGAGLVRADLAIGTVAAAPAPTSSSQPTASTFSATFKVSPNVNEWWVELYVSSSSTVSKVDIRVNGGVWQSLPKTNWGAWAKSMNVAKGAKVEFRATSSTGQIALSSPQTWMGTTSTSTSSPSPSPSSSPAPTFTASFSPRAQTNVWWVETGVSSSSTVTKVDARVNGGSWTQLPRTDWGTWAKSIHAPSGSKVEFRAASSTGATATSAAYTWG